MYKLIFLFFLENIFLIKNPDQPIRVGWFPANCVQLQTVTTPTTPVSLYLNDKRGINLKKEIRILFIKLFLSLEFPRYIAIFPYEAQQDDELSFPADAIFEILEDAGNSGWFKARYNNKTGLIPSTYVKPLDEHNPCKLTNK